MKIKIKLDVCLPSGAKVELTPKQESDITQYVTNLILGVSTPKYKLSKKRKYPQPQRGWNERELDIVRTLYQMYPEPSHMLNAKFV